MRRLLLLSTILLLCIATSHVAFGWGNATHTYLAAKLGAQRGQMNLNEMYGAVLPDAFNFILDQNGMYAAYLTHNDPMAFVKYCLWGELKATAFGFASHNEAWGADKTAHIMALTGPNTGWVIAKGVELESPVQSAVFDILSSQLPEEVAMQISYGLAPTFSHDLVETAVDIMVRRDLAPQVGMWMVKAADERPRTVPVAFAAAYAKDLSNATGIKRSEAVAFIVGAESANRDFCKQYGGIFTLTEEEELYGLASLDAQIGAGFINAYLGNPDPGVVISPEEVLPLLQLALAKVTEGSGYGPELAATLQQVRDELREHHVTSGPLPFAFHKEGATDEAVSNVPTNYSLGQNYPNPFNPTTTIQYSVAGVGPQATGVSNVRLVVYDALGQEVATLVNAPQAPGTYTVRWDASRHASGVYIYRLVAGNFTETKRMLLVR